MNEQPIKMRGACNHESFAGVGGALPPRVDLLRIQQLRGVGMNAWRTSHNPPEPILLDITDRLGVLVLDENRVLATAENCQGSGCRNLPQYAGDPAADMGALALRDRNHASVAWYSACNEAGTLACSTQTHPMSILTLNPHTIPGRNRMRRWQLAGGRLGGAR